MPPQASPRRRLSSVARVGMGQLADRSAGAADDGFRCMAPAAFQFGVWGSGFKEHPVLIAEVRPAHIPPTLVPNTYWKSGLQPNGSLSVRYVFLGGLCPTLSLKGVLWKLWRVIWRYLA